MDCFHSLHSRGINLIRTCCLDIYFISLLYMSSRFFNPYTSKALLSASQLFCTDRLLCGELSRFSSSNTVSIASKCYLSQELPSGMSSFELFGSFNIIALRQSASCYRDEIYMTVAVSQTSSSQSELTLRFLLKSQFIHNFLLLSSLCATHLTIVNFSCSLDELQVNYNNERSRYIYKLRC